MSGAKARLRPAWRAMRLLAVALLPLLLLPLRAAEPPRDGTPADPPRPAPSTSPSTSTTSPSPATATATATAPGQAAANPGTEAATPAPEDGDEQDGEPLERVSADNNLSFPVDI